MSAAATEIIARAVVRRDERLLLVRERAAAWSFLPGGHVEPGERVEVALLREIAEELGTGATIGRLVGVVEHGFVHDGTARHQLNLVFAVTIDDPDPTSREGHLEFHWLPMDRLADTDVRPEALKNALMAGGGPFWRASP